MDLHLLIRALVQRAEPRQRLIRRENWRQVLCGPTVNASLAVPCLFSSTPTKPGGNTYPIVPGSCHPGSLGRDTITGPGFINTDFSVTKDTKITERLNLQFRTEMFDIFNHPNFGFPVPGLGPPTGLIYYLEQPPTSILGDVNGFAAADVAPRMIQLKAELKF
jgi:hypothetical protein